MAMARNNTFISFRNIGGAARYVALWDAATGGNLCCHKRLYSDGTQSTELNPSAGDDLDWFSNTFEVSIGASGGELTNSATTLAVEAILKNNVYVALHTGTPPTTANQVTADGPDRKVMMPSNWTVTDS